MKVKLELGEISATEFGASASQENEDGGTAIVTGGAAGNSESAAAGTDPKLKTDPPNGYWEGSVHWMLLGKPFLESTVYDGMFIVKDRHIELTDDEQVLTPLKINIL